MKKYLSTKTFPKVLSTLICVALICSCTITAFAAAIGFGVGHATFASDTFDFYVTGTVFYNSNTSSALDVYSLRLIIDNDGIYDVDYLDYYVHDGNYSKYTAIKGSLENPIVSGGYGTLEMEWLPVCKAKGFSNSSFSKNGTDKFVRTHMFAGHNNSILAGWNCDWFQTTYDAEFY